MAPISRFTAEPLDDDNMILLFDGRRLEHSFVGRKIEAQFQVFDWFLLILEGDPTKIVACLLDQDGRGLDEETIGHWYFDSLFEDAAVIADRLPASPSACRCTPTLATSGNLYAL